MSKEETTFGCLAPHLPNDFDSLAAGLADALYMCCDGCCCDNQEERERIAEVALNYMRTRGATP